MSDTYKVFVSSGPKAGDSAEKITAVDPLDVMECFLGLNAGELDSNELRLHGFGVYSYQHFETLIFAVRMD